MKTTGKIYLARAVAEKLGVPIQGKIQVRAGSIVVLTQLVIRDNGRKTYLLSPSLLRALALTNRKKLRLRYDQTAEMLHLGPIIGILASHIPNKVEYDPISLQAELIYLSNTGKGIKGKVYIFTPGSINWNTKTVRGYNYYQKTAQKGVWVSSIYPLPDVVYDRISSRRAESRKAVKRTKERLRKLPYLKYFNPSYLNKWKVHQMLIAEPELGNYLPETKPLTIENLEEMLGKHRILYLKPNNGSLGRGIIKVIKSETGKLRYVAHRKGRHRGRADDPTELMSKTRVYRKNKAYIIQKGIPLANYKGSPFDLRIIFQKNLQGEWQIGKKFVRVAPRGSSISNLSSGGRVERSKRVFRRLYKNSTSIQSKEAEIGKLCKITALRLEKATGETFGELGLDIGIDKKGRLWLIEVNSKPRKTTETNSSRGIIRNTFRRPLQYGIHLAGFKNL